MKRPIPILLFALLCFSALAATDIRAQVLSEGEPSVLKEDSTQPNYVYDLKALVQRSRQNIRDVNEKIKDQAVQKRNQQREEKAREYFLQAQKLTEEGRLEEAREFFEKAIRITEHPEMKYYIKESEHRTKVQAVALAKQESEQQRRVEEEGRAAFERVENMYQGAVSLYKQQRFKEAKDEFAAVEEVYPDYKAVRSYLQIIDQDIAQAEQQNIKNQGKEIEHQEKEVEIARLHEKELWRKEIEKKESERKKQLEQQALGVYDEAVKLYQDRKYLAAKEKFQEVEWVVPDFKSTRSYLQRIEKDVSQDKIRLVQERQKSLDKQRWDEILSARKAEEEKAKARQQREREMRDEKKDQADFVYKSGIALFDKEQYAQALEKFDEVEALYPDYKSTRDYRARAEALIKTARQRDEEKNKKDAEQKLWEEQASWRKAEKEKFARLTGQADDAFKEGNDLYRMGRLIEAKEKFMAVDERVPDYKSCRSMIKKIDDEISTLVLNERKEKDLATQRADLERLKTIRDKAEGRYNEAIIAYDNKDYVLAKAKFQEVESVYPDFRKTSSYLARIGDDIKQKEESEARLKVTKEAEGLYVQALALYNGDQFEDAKKKFVEVVALVPDYKQTPFYLERIDDDIIRKKEKDLNQVRERQAEMVYNQAVALYDSKEFEQAKSKFLEGEAIFPDYKDTARYLAGIDAAIVRKQKDQEERARTEQAEAIYAQAVSLYKAGAFAAAKEKFVRTEVVYPDYKDVTKYLVAVDVDIERKRRDDELKKKNDEAAPLYEQALGLYKSEEFAEAKKKLVQVQLISPGYKETETYLARIDQNISSLEARLTKEDRLHKAEAFYAEAMKLYSNHQFADAKQKFLNIVALEPNYKNVKSYLSRIDNDIRDERGRTARKLQEEGAEKPYAKAVALYHDQRFEEAKSGFLEVSQILPDYKKTKQYLSHIDADISRYHKELERSRLAKAESGYASAQQLMQQGDLPKAYEIFSAVESGYPDFKATRKNLESLQKQLAARGIEVHPSAAAGASVPGSSGVTPVQKSVLSDDAVLEMYKKAVELYKAKKNKDAEAAFEDVVAARPSYRFAQRYLDTLRHAPSSEAGIPAAKKTPETSTPVATPVPVGTLAPVAAPVPVAKASRPSGVEQLSRRSDALYREIKALANDKELVDTAKTFAAIDRILENLENDKKRLARSLQRQTKEAKVVPQRVEAAGGTDKASQDEAEGRQVQLKQQEAEKLRQDTALRAAQNQKEVQDLRSQERARIVKAREDDKELHLKTEVLYQQGVQAFRSGDLVAARDRFSQAQKLLPGYRDIDERLLRVEKAEGEQGVLKEEAQDRTHIAALAEKADTANQEALVLSKQGDIAGVQRKFDDLEGLLKEIKIAKDRMMARRDDFRATWQRKAEELKAHVMEKKPARDVKAAVAELTPRQQATQLYREGQTLYGAGHYPEARVKFTEAMAADASLRASYSYIQRIDRILSRRDYEDQESRRQEERRQLEQDRDAKESAQGPAIKDPARALIVQQEGINLYKVQRYKEARIKFEELGRVGDDRQKDKARRYLTLIERGMEQDQAKAAEQQKKQEAVYLEAKRAEIRMAWERDKASGQKNEDNVKSEKQLGIDRQAKLRAIEHDNDVERKKMIKEEVHQETQANADARHEKNKHQKIAAQQHMKMDADAAVPGKPDAVQLPAVVTPATPVATGVKTEGGAREKLEAAAPLKKAAKPFAIDAREQRKFERMMAQQKAEEITEAKRRRLLIERQHQADELEKLRQEERKRHQEDAFIKRNQDEVERKIRETGRQVEAAVSFPQGGSPAGAKPVVSEVIQSATDEERARLEAQKAAIQRDFEAGVERLYGEAVDVFNKKRYSEAKADFQQVDELINGYKKTGFYLEQIRKMLARATPPPVKEAFVIPSADVRRKAVAEMLDQIESSSAK